MASGPRQHATSDDAAAILAFLVVAAVVVAIVLACGLIVLWIANTLFGASLAYSFRHVVAAGCLVAFVRLLIVQRGK